MKDDPGEFRRTHGPQQPRHTRHARQGRLPVILDALPFPSHHKIRTRVLPSGQVPDSPSDREPQPATSARSSQVVAAASWSAAPPELRWCCSGCSGCSGSR
jgi:hypothetical protein